MAKSELRALTTQLPTDLYEKIVEIAEREQRNVSQTARMLLRDAVADRMKTVE